ncbi:MAG: flagellar export chaperone FliS [Candidatus Acididesulfobacter guangdongensis]|uniref:Flagellar secretion chaperone FliS n=1 Tax=Acididesulfobacter guangdongensis TaxID=2597225 RepID=A0A519BFD2_ACIG2|nr:MAG: flagellar export chaperone FliS [Candidatus Acididesulfobacter guangdongensis]
MLNTGAYQYQNVAASTIDNGTVILMAYEGAITFIQQAKEKLAQNDYAGKSIAISNAVALINELNLNLNMEKGGETAKNLSKLYVFLSYHLTTANLKKDSHKLDESLVVLENLVNGWKIILEKEKQRAAASANAIPESSVANDTVNAAVSSVSSRI